MRKGLIVAGAFFVLFLFAGGMLVLLGAQSRDLAGSQAPPAQPVPGAAAGRAGGMSAVTLTAPAAGGAGAFDLNQVLETPSGLLYALSRQRGFLVSFDQGRTWSEPVRVLDWWGDGGYPSSVQLPDGQILTAYYAAKIEGHDRYHMGVVLWDPARSLRP